MSLVRMTPPEVTRVAQVSVAQDTYTRARELFGYATNYERREEIPRREVLAFFDVGVVPYTDDSVTKFRGRANDDIAAGASLRNIFTVVASILTIVFAVVAIATLVAMFFDTDISTVLEVLTILAVVIGLCVVSHWALCDCSELPFFRPLEHLNSEWVDVNISSYLDVIPPEGLEKAIKLRETFPDLHLKVQYMKKRRGGQKYLHWAFLVARIHGYDYHFYKWNQRDLKKIQP